MTTFNQSVRRIALVTISNRPRRTHSARILAWMGLLILPAVLSTARPSYAVAQSASLYIPGHLYLGSLNGNATDVTDAYVQTGSVYDAQKGHTVQTGYVTQASGNIDVTVDINEGEVDDWDHHRIGFVVREDDLPEYAQFM